MSGFTSNTLLVRIQLIRICWKWLFRPAFGCTPQTLVEIYNRYLIFFNELSHLWTILAIKNCHFLQCNHCLFVVTLCFQTYSEKLFFLLASKNEIRKKFRNWKFVHEVLALYFYLLSYRKKHVWLSAKKICWFFMS